MKNEKKYIPFTEYEINKLIKLFHVKIIICNKQKIVLVKFNSKGYKFFRNYHDEFYYAAVIEFKEPINLKNPIYYNIWNGNMILKLRSKTFEDMLKIIQTNSIFLTAKSNTINCLYMNDYDKKNRTIIISKNPKKYSYTDYNYFYNWYKSNYIWITLSKNNIKPKLNLSEINSGVFPSKRIPKPVPSNKITSNNFFIKFDDNTKAINIEDKKYLICFASS